MNLLSKKIFFTLFKLKFTLCGFLLTCAMGLISAHPSPNSMLFLEIQNTGVAVELLLPLSELEPAFKQNITQNPDAFIAQFGDQLKTYLLAHIHPTSADNRAWTVEIRNMSLLPPQESPTGGSFQDLKIQLWLQPPSGATARHFTLNYDVIIHQVVTHSALVSIRQDWETGVFGEKPCEIGVISLDIINNRLLPLVINQESHGLSGGFKGMVSLGMKHIAEGTDHLLFLLTLLLPAPLLVQNRRWKQYGGLRYSLIKLLKIITAFTIGHSITLLLGTLGWQPFSSQFVEIAIAFSILVSAFHAFRPLFYDKETYIAVGFGLIHGLAFSATLLPLKLEKTQMALSILGFNIGIEMMQIGIMCLILPSFILLSQTKLYGFFRKFGALLSSIAALGWIAARVSGTPNFISVGIDKVVPFGVWIIGLLAIFAVVSYAFSKQRLA